jgi:hypothetical protein
VNFGHWPDGPALDQFHDTAVILPGMDLCTHLGDPPGLAGSFGHGAGFENGMGQGLLAVDVPARLQGHHGGDGMRVVRRSNNDSIDAFSVEHLAVINVEVGPGKALSCRPGTAFIDVTQGDDLGPCFRCLRPVVLPLAGYPNNTNLQAVVDPWLFVCLGGTTWEEAGYSTGGPGLEKATAGQGSSHRIALEGIAS